ncbi:DUF3306 domain-containing protein [Manganibacter manganicus]|uniref:DUF3306 domain-containing protein n=1 Tax=Manganibacter manganicus TaxID=1873176 RepID=A0A1V8RL30_9HYPH|nr:DUF3306 domain-containing protein [Pseudaminobacter manganicus]OQM73908.1 hypothetical protein BFN67_06115 [Pseudaminobacter manganicus]
MSGNGDNILARWSRRKLAARSEAPAVAESDREKEQAPDEIADDGDASVPEPDASEEDAAESDEAEVVASLPRIEELTAESDISAFLKKGVPAVLKRAALRRVWSIDPGIRDYVGPSEYAWDFNQPGAMTGFGPIEAKEAVVGFLSKAVRAVDIATEPAEAGQPAEPPPEQSADASADTTPAGEETEAPSPQKPADESSGADTPTLAAETKTSPPAEGRAHSASPDDSNSSRPVEAVARPRHGGAMPR